MSNRDWYYFNLGQNGNFWKDMGGTIAVIIMLGTILALLQFSMYPPFSILILLWLLNKGDKASGRGLLAALDAHPVVRIGAIANTVSGMACVALALLNGELSRAGMSSWAHTVYKGVELTNKLTTTLGVLILGAAIVNIFWKPKTETTCEEEEQ